MRRLVCILALGLAFPAVAAGFPDYLVIRERLGAWPRDNGGGRLDDQSLLVRLVDASGLTLFEELHCGVRVQGADMEVEIALGTVDPAGNPLDLRFDGRWSVRVVACGDGACVDGIPVDADLCDGAILLDEPLHVVAYAWRSRHSAEADHAHFADDCDRLDGLDSTDFMPAGTDRWVDETGDAMTGPLLLPADPVEDMQAATKKYVDEQIRNAIPRGYAILGPDLTPPPGFAPSGRYIATDGEWQTLAPMLFAGRISAATRDGKVYANESGGLGIYDPATDTWGSGPAPIGQLITNLDGALHVIGDVRGVPVHWEELPSGLWSSRAAPPSAPVGTIAAHGGRIYALGNDDFASWDPATDSWRPLPRVPFVFMSECQLVAFQGRLWAIAGQYSFDDAHDGVMIFNPATGGWSEGPRLKRSRRYPAVAEFDGRIYVFGGDSFQWLGGSYDGDDGSQDAIEVYDPAIGSWALVPSRMPTSRVWRGAAALGGRIHLLGGSSGWTGRGGTDAHEAFTPQQRWYVHVKQ